MGPSLICKSLFCQRISRVPAKATLSLAIGVELIWNNGAMREVRLLTLAPVTSGPAQGANTPEHCYSGEECPTLVAGGSLRQIKKFPASASYSSLFKTNGGRH